MPSLPPLVPALFRGCRASRELRTGRKGTRRHRCRRRLPGQDARRPRRAYPVRPRAPRRHAEPARQGVSCRRAAHPHRHRRVHGPLPQPRAGAAPEHRRRGINRRSVADTEAPGIQGEPPRYRHRTRDRPPACRPATQRLRSPDRLGRRDHRAERTPRNTVRGRDVPRLQPRPAGEHLVGRATSWTCIAGLCCTIWAGLPTGRTGSPLTACHRPTCPVHQASASAARWCARRSRAWEPSSDVERRLPTNCDKGRWFRCSTNSMRPTPACG